MAPPALFHVHLLPGLPPEAPRAMSDKRNKIVNTAILATIAILLFNPSGVVGRWIGTTYREWQQRQRISEIWEELVSAPSVLGSPYLDRGRAIVEFADYDCPACRMVAPTIAELTQRGEAIVVVRYVVSQPVGSPGREAARAAICAEQQGRFAGAHEALMTDEKWIEERDWTGLAASIGLADMASFSTCLSDESTEQRLLRDQSLADTLRIPGTPTYVTMQGLHVGAGGFRGAMTAVSNIRDIGTSGGPSTRRLELETEPLFDTSREFQPDDLGLVAANAGFFLSTDRFVVVDRTELLFVDPSSRSVRVVGGEGSGPGEFNFITGAMRAREGVAVWDLLSQRISFFSSDGELLRSSPYDPLAFRHLMAEPVAVHPSGDILFRDGNGLVTGARGRAWDPARYITMGRDGQLQTVATAKGDELFYGSGVGSGGGMSDRVVFGHRTLEGIVGDLLVVAESDASTINVMDWSGSVHSRIPMPAGVRVSPQQMRMAQASHASKWDRRIALANQFRQMGGSYSVGQPDRDIPANEITPGIDRLFVDSDDRLWFREYRLPDRDSAVWQVWDLQLSEQLFSLQVAAEDRLLDARGDRVLLRAEDAFGIPRVAVKQIRP